MKQTKETGLTQSEKKFNQQLNEIIELLRIQNHIHAIAVQALINKKITEENDEYSSPIA